MRSRLLTLVVCLNGVLFAQNAVLPKIFSGWQKTSANGELKPDAVVLKEYGLKDTEQATYTREGRTIRLSAFRFNDGTGAFGAFTFMREPQMVAEKLCDQAASAREHILFRCADILVDAKWDRITAMTLAELRSLAKNLPMIRGPAAQSPNVPPSLREVDDLKFALGPAAYTHFAQQPGWDELIPPVATVDFARSGEVILAPVEGGRAIVTVIRYPTPHIAIQEIAKLDAWAQQPPPDAAARNINSLTKRSGPIVAAVRGTLGTDEGKATLDLINYEADVTWSESTGLEKRNNIGSLVYAAIMLAIIIFGFAVIGGVFFGGFRVLLRKAFPGRFVDRPEAVEFISLNLEDARDSPTQRK